MQESSDNRLSEHLSAFYHYLTMIGIKSKHSRSNYISWLKFLYQQGYPILEMRSTNDIEDLLITDKDRQRERSVYTKSVDITNFRSALRSFLKYLQSDYLKVQENSIIAEVNKVENDSTLTKTERTAIINARIGQGIFRERLVDYWHGCSVTKFPCLDLLIASHIKPWKDADNNERLSVFNGLLLLPNYDKLFDNGYISFEDNGHIIYSRFVDATEKRLLGMDNSIHLTRIDDMHRPFLRYHRDHCLML